MEIISGDKFKDNLIGILTEAGYDTKSAIKTLNSDKISDIERHVNHNRDRYRDILKKTRYENCEVFQFLPGHTALILTLPEYIPQLQSQTTKKIVPRKRKHSESEPSDHPSSQNHEPANEINNSSIEDHTDVFADIAKIRQQLIDKLNKFAQSKQIEWSFNINHIINLRVEDNSVKCRVQCPTCGRKIPCTFVSHWICTNVQAHIKTHIIVEAYELDEQNRLQPINGAAHSQKIIRITNSSGLQKFLND